MTGLEVLGRILIVVGALTILAGVVLIFIRRVPLIGRLPGDIVIESDRVTIFFPIVTFIILSIILTIILNVVIRLLR